MGRRGGGPRRSENCTIRLIVLRDGDSGAARQSVITAFTELGVDGESIERFGMGMVALDVPPPADLVKVQRLLHHGVANEWWDMEEGCMAGHLRHLTPLMWSRTGPSLGRPRLPGSGQ